MRGFSKAIIAGNLTRDPEVRTTPSGAQVSSFAVAVNRVYRDATGEQKENVSFIDCSAWGRLGETIAQYARKGSGIILSGRLDQRSWEDKNGQKRSRVEIIVEDFNFVGSGDRGNSNSYSGSTNTATTAATSNSETSTNDNNATPDDIPEGEINLDEMPF